MTVTYGFYNSINGDRKYDAIQMSRIFDGLITDGIYASIGSAFAVSASSGMTINVASGRAWLDHTWTYNDATIQLVVEASEPALNRIDTVVIEVNSDASVRTNTIKIIKGTPAGSPVAPTLSFTSTLKQYPLANIAVGAGVTSITSGNITNRVGVAGGTAMVTGIITPLDFASLWGQYDARFNEWLATYSNNLTTEQAANLQAQINVLSGVDNTGWIPVTASWTYNNASTVNVPSNATLTFKKGWGVRFRQGGGYKYFYIVDTPSATTLTLAAGSDYSVANAAITDISFSTVPSNAYGFPNYFNYFVSIGGSGSAGTYAESVDMEGRFSINAGLVRVQCAKMVTNKGSWTGSVGINLPVTPSNIYVSPFQIHPCWWANGAAIGTGTKALCRLTNSQSMLFLDFFGASFFDWADLAVNDHLQLDLSYWI